MDRYDLIAIGGGTAGLVSAAGSAMLGARVALVERDRMGGECLWTGCVPSKALIAAARAAHAARTAGRYGVRVPGVEVDFAGVMRWVHGARARIAPHDSPERFRGLGVDVVPGTARFVDRRTIEVDDRRLRGRAIVIATGTRAAVPAIPGLAELPFLTNETLFELRDQPRSLLVLGAGVIGLEMAQAFARLGTRVTVLDVAPELLPREDQELVALLRAQLEAEGIEIVLGQAVSGAGRHGGDLTLQVDGPAGPRRFTGDALLVATGRRPALDALGLEHAGVRASPDGVEVDAGLRTSARGVWAAGDVVSGGLRFTHVADYQARVVVRNALFPFRQRADYRVVPWVMYTDPELAHLGLTEREARERHGADVRVWRRAFDQVDRAIADGHTAGMVKLITNARGRLLGAHVLGHGAGNLIAELAVAMRHDIPVGRIADTIHAYPTYPEAIRHAANAHQAARLTGLAKRMLGWLARH